MLYFLHPNNPKPGELRVEKCMKQILNVKGLNNYYIGIVYVISIISICASLYFASHKFYRENYIQNISSNCHYQLRILASQTIVSPISKIFWNSASLTGITDNLEILTSGKVANSLSAFTSFKVTGFFKTFHRLNFNSTTGILIGRPFCWQLLFGKHELYFNSQHLSTNFRRTVLR
jgi:hypothetical protein